MHLDRGHCQATLPFVRAPGSCDIEYRAHITHPCQLGLLFTFHEAGIPWLPNTFEQSIRRVPTVPSFAALGVGYTQAPTIVSLNATTYFGAARPQPLMRMSIQRDRPKSVDDATSIWQWTRSLSVRVSSEVTLYGHTLATHRRTRSARTSRASAGCRTSCAMHNGPSASYLRSVESPQFADVCKRQIEAQGKFK
jgi:hypothetical protein